MSRGPKGQHRARPGRLLKRFREEVPRLCELVTDIERRLDHEGYDAAIPTLEPTLDEVRLAAGKLRHLLGELELIVELEHAQDRRPVRG